MKGPLCGAELGELASPVLGALLGRTDRAPLGTADGDELGPLKGSGNWNSMIRRDSQA